MNNFCKVEAWKIENLYSALIDNDGKRKVNIPAYQRSLVWSKNQKVQFLDSIKRGYPVGALLLHKVGVENENEIYSIIDGLQRTSTIKQYSEKPTDFLTPSDLPEAHLIKICNLFPCYDSLTTESLSSTIIQWLSTVSGFEEKDGYSSYKLFNHIQGKFNFEWDYKNVSSDLIDLLAEIKDNSNIKNIELPVILYTGPKEFLPAIFERLNKEGTKLNKFQVYASSWAQFSIKVNNRKIINNIIDKYNSLIEMGFDISGFDPAAKNYEKEYSVFEYLFGLGKTISPEFQQLFNQNDKSEIDSFIYLLSAIALGLSVKNMDDLPEKIMTIDQQRFENAIFDSIHKTTKILNPIIGLNLNRNKGNTQPLNNFVHSEYQIVSIIATIFKDLYDSDLNNKSNNNFTMLQSNIEQYYLYDILRDYWQSSVDSKIMETVLNKRYHIKINLENWNSVLEEWFLKQLDKKEKNRIRIKDSDLLFLKYIYSHLLSSYQDSSMQDYQIDHLISVSRLKKLAENSEGLPISAVGNLSLVDSEINRRKQDNTIYEYVKKDNVAENQAKLMIENFEEFSFVKENDYPEANSIAIETYTAFLKKRHTILKEKFYEYYNIC